MVAKGIQEGENANTPTERRARSLCAVVPGSLGSGLQIGAGPIAGLSKCGGGVCSVWDLHPTQSGTLQWEAWGGAGVGLATKDF